MADDDVAELQAKLEQAERQLALFDPAAVAAYGDQRAREAAAKAESALAAAQGALRRCRNLTHLQHCDIGSVRWVGEEVGRIVDEALSAEPRAAPPALPAELSGKGEQRRPTIEELEAILREPDGTYEVHILPNGEVHSRRILKAVEPEPGEAKKEEEGGHG